MSDTFGDCVDFRGRIQHSYSDEAVDAVIGFMEESKQQKQIKAKHFPNIKKFMTKHQDKIMVYVNKHNKRNDKILTFENMLELAEGWPVDDIEILTSKVNKGKIMSLTHELLSI